MTHGPDSLTPALCRRLEPRLEGKAADALRIDYLFLELSPGPCNLDDAMKALAITPGTAPVFVESPYFLQNRDLLGTLTLKHRMPAMFDCRARPCRSPCSYGVTVKYIHQRSAWYVSKTLRGAKPASLPVELPTNYELAIHRGTAAALGLTIPRALLLQAELLVD